MNLFPGKYCQQTVSNQCRMSETNYGEPLVDNNMYHTPILWKPVYYGADMWSIAFLALLSTHIFVAASVSLSLFSAFITTKGSKWHVRFGNVFKYGMLYIATTGIFMQIIRFTSYKQENDKIYKGYHEPSSYMDRIAFLNDAIGTYQVLYQSMIGKNITQFSQIIQYGKNNKYKFGYDLFGLLILPIFNIIFTSISIIISFIYLVPYQYLINLIAWILLSVFNLYHWYLIFNKYGFNGYIAKYEGILLHSMNLIFLSIFVLQAFIFSDGVGLLDIFYYIFIGQRVPFNNNHNEKDYYQYYGLVHYIIPLKMDWFKMITWIIVKLFLLFPAYYYYKRQTTKKYDNLKSKLDAIRNAKKAKKRVMSSTETQPIYDKKINYMSV